MAGTYRAPGRVNLIGEHTDYNQGFVLPVALDLACHVHSEPNANGSLTVASAQLNQTRAWTLDNLRAATPQRDWTDYVAGVAQQLEAAGYRTPPLDLHIDSQVPVGSGLSSSAALEVSIANAKVTADLTKGRRSTGSGGLFRCLELTQRSWSGAVRPSDRRGRRSPTGTDRTQSPSRRRADA